jgi:hypothetical protein
MNLIPRIGIVERTIERHLLAATPASSPVGLAFTTPSIVDLHVMLCTAAT